MKLICGIVFEQRRKKNDHVGNQEDYEHELVSTVLPQFHSQQHENYEKEPVDVAENDLFS